MNAALVGAAERIKESVTENEVHQLWFTAGTLDISHSFNIINKDVSKTSLLY